MMRDRAEILGSISVLCGKDGYLGREVLGAPIFLPLEIQLQDSALVWSDYEEEEFQGRLKHSRKLNKGALDAFIRLAWPDRTRRDGEDVLAFARKWGVLELCEHELPCTHPLHDLLDRHLYVKHASHIRPIRTCSATRVESLGTWRFFARRAALLVQLAASMRRSDDSGRSEVSRKTVVTRLNKWLEMAEVGVVCFDTAGGDWPSGLQIRIGTRGGLFGVLAIQLLLATTLNEFLFTCAACGKFFNAAPAERPRTGQRAFCSECGRKAAMRFAARDYRARRRGI
jgi:hypothetical protein